MQITIRGVEASIEGENRTFVSVNELKEIILLDYCIDILDQLLKEAMVHKKSVILSSHTLKFPAIYERIAFLYVFLIFFCYSISLIFIL